MRAGTGVGRVESPSAQTEPLDDVDLLCTVTSPAVDPGRNLTTDYSFDFLVGGLLSG